jgi:MATE family multidrug resistance protein
MRTPLAIALAVNLLNAVLDPLLIFGAGPVPALGLAGAAWASTAAHWLGAGAAVAVVVRRLGAPRRIDLGSVRDLLAVGRDLFFRTGALMVFLTAATAAANHVGTEAGAAHQAVRQMWTFTAFVLDAYATAAQSLVGWFHGAGRRDLARRVAAVTCLWSLATGVALAAAMSAGTRWVALGFVPESARAVFPAAWWVAVLSQPLNALSFATDGLHWGTGDYRFLRDGMLAATAVGGAGLWLAVGPLQAGLGGVWCATALWIGVRAVLGMLRVWPGIGRSPYRKGEAQAEVSHPRGPAPPEPGSS